jgi:hypothetical protein
MPLEELKVGEDLTYQEYPVKILDTSEELTCIKRYRKCKVSWSNQNKEDQLKVGFLDIFSNMSESHWWDSS